jgi:hypothetical protein
MQCSIPYEGDYSSIPFCCHSITLLLSHNTIGKVLVAKIECFIATPQSCWVARHWLHQNVSLARQAKL